MDFFVFSKEKCKKIKKQKKECKKNVKTRQILVY